MQTQQPVFTDCNNCGSADHREYACTCACHRALGQALTWDQAARVSDKITLGLRAILDEARREQESSLLAHATALEADRAEALRLSVAASAAVDVALHAVTSYVAHGFYYPASPRGPEETPLHERCRLARNAIDTKIAEVFAAHRAEAS